MKLVAPLLEHELRGHIANDLAARDALVTRAIALGAKEEEIDKLRDDYQERVIPGESLQTRALRIEVLDDRTPLKSQQRYERLMMAERERFESNGRVHVFPAPKSALDLRVEKEAARRFFESTPTEDETQAALTFDEWWSGDAWLHTHEAYTQHAVERKLGTSKRPADMPYHLYLAKLAPGGATMINRKDFVASFFQTSAPIGTVDDTMIKTVAPRITGDEDEPLEVKPRSTAPTIPSAPAMVEKPDKIPTPGESEDEPEDGSLSSPSSARSVSFVDPAQKIFDAFRAREAERRKHQHQTATGCWVDNDDYVPPEPDPAAMSRAYWNQPQFAATPYNVRRILWEQDHRRVPEPLPS